MKAQRTLVPSGLNRVGSGRASGRNQRSFSLTNNSNYDGKIAGLYDLEETLGRGHFAVVKLARHVFTGEKVAVKVIDKTKLDEVSRAHLFQEVRCMKLVQHPNVVRLYEVIDTQTKLYLILELGDGGDLYDYIMRHENGLDEESARHYFRQVVHAISYCHQLHVVHRDLKPENVVFFEKLGMVKLTDFGFSNKYNPGQKLETSCGSLAYSAPEILLGDSYDAPAVDIWSLGVILYMLVCGHPPFQEANDSETLTMIMDCKYTVPPHVSEGCRRLIGRMLQRDPVKRDALEDIANDPWLQAGSTIQPADYLPLVSREHLSEEDHALILQKMVNGSIATKEEILDALDKNEYNNITATYFLLAERKLRAQRQEQAQMLNLGQRPESSPTSPGRNLLCEAVNNKERMPSPDGRMGQLSSPSPPPGPSVTDSIPSPTKVVALQTSKTIDSPQHIPHPRPRKYSVVDEEDEAGASGSESSRRSQRSSSNSLASQRTSSTSLASQRTSNNSLAGSLRARGLLNTPVVVTSVSHPPRATLMSSSAATSDKLRLELKMQSDDYKVGKTGAGRTFEKQKSIEQPLEAPAPFPTTSNIGLGLRSPRASPLTSPVSSHRPASSVLPLTNSGRTTPSSVSPTSPSTPSSPPGSSPQGGPVKSRSSLPSSSRVLHVVRSSPQLILNEIFEEAESCSDSESNTGASRTDRLNAGLKHKVSATSVNACGPVSARRPQPRASSVGPSVFPVRPSGSSTSPPSLVRRYEQRRKLAKSRTASCSSSDASDDDNENRKKRVDKLKALPRRDSHDDSSDPGGDGPSGTDGDGAGLSGGGGTSSLDSSRTSDGSQGSRKGGGSDQKGSGCSSSSTCTSSRPHLQPTTSSAGEVHLDRPKSSRYRVLGSNSAGRRYVKSSYNSLLSPGLGNETHLRASQSLSSLTEVCEVPDSPNSTSLDIPASSKPQPTRSCTNLEKIEEAGASSSSADSLRPKQMPLLLPEDSANPTECRESAEESHKSGLSLGRSPSVESKRSEEPCSSGVNRRLSKVVPTEAKKQKRLKQLFSRRESGSSFKRSERAEKQWGGRRLRVRNGSTSSGHGSKTEVEMDEASGGSSCSGIDPTASGQVSDSKVKSMSFLRSRLYKAKSLGSLVKERILVEASHCQYELWKRFGRKSDVNQNSGSAPTSRSSSKRFANGAKCRVQSTDCSAKKCDTPVAIVHNVPKHCSPC